MGGLSSIVADKGYVFLKDLEPGKNVDEVAKTLGSPSVFFSNSPSAILTPYSRESAKAHTYSSHFGLGEFPLHTDLANWHRPPRYLMLRCAVGASNVATKIVDPRPAISKLGTNFLSRIVLKPRRRSSGRLSLLPLVQPVAGVLMTRWDECFLTPASCASAEYAEKFKNEVISEEATLVHLANLGDTIIIDNWIMFHGRAAVPEADRTRIVERVYLEAIV